MPTTVAGCFTELLSRLELTSAQSSAASTHARGIRDFFDSNYTMAERAFTIGSYRRGTIIRAERDIDLLAVLGYPAHKALHEGGSSKLLTHVRNKLNEGYARTDVSSKKVAAILDFKDIRAEVVPAFKRNGGGFIIPDGNDGWQSTNPPFHTKLINDADAGQASRLKPLIQLMKFWNITNGRHLTSFHVELMVQEMWAKAAVPAAMPTAVASTLKVFGSWINAQRSDPWAAGGRIDAYLRTAERQTVINLANNDGKASAEAEHYRLAGNATKAVERWQVVYRHEFPALG